MHAGQRAAARLCWLDSNSMNDITLVLQAIDRGEKIASKDLLPLVYEELRRLATARMAHESAGQTLQPTALVHEAWLQLVGDGDRNWQNRAHFFGAAADAMRRILIDNARRKAALKRGGDQHRVDIEDLEISAATPDEYVLLINEALERLETEDPEKARIVTLKFFGGLTNEEVAENLGMGLRTVVRQWTLAKIKMFQWLRPKD
jgi:RNA polymerase sigma factor (TIGR02999 family)